MPNDIPYWVASIGAEVRLRSKDARTNAHSIRVNELLVEIEARETALRQPADPRRSGGTDEAHRGDAG